MTVSTSGLKVYLNCLNLLTTLIPYTPLSNLNCMIYWDSFLHVLDFALHLKDGLIVIEIYLKLLTATFISHFPVYTCQIAKGQSLMG